MLPYGEARGSGWWETRCARCSATAVTGVVKPCPWCIDNSSASKLHQAELLLRAPEVDPYSAETGRLILGAWKDRMHRGIEAQLITREQANRAWKRACREVRNVAA